MEISNENVIQIVQNTWQSILGMDIDYQEEKTFQEKVEKTLTSCVHINGFWEGVVTIECSKKTAAKIAAIIFDVSKEQVALEEIQDVLSELVNVVGGNFKALLPGSCYLSLPLVIEGAQFNLTVRGGSICHQLTFHYQECPIKIKIFQRQDKSSFSELEEDEDIEQAGGCGCIG